MTVVSVDRFDRASRFYEAATGQRIARRWYVPQTGFRVEARARREERGIYLSTLRDLAQIERILAR